MNPEKIHYKAVSAVCWIFYLYLMALLLCLVWVGWCWALLTDEKGI